MYSLEAGEISGFDAQAKAAGACRQWREDLGYGPDFDEFPEEFVLDGYEEPDWGVLSQFSRAKSNRRH